MAALITLSQAVAHNQDKIQGPPQQVGESHAHAIPAPGQMGNMTTHRHDADDDEARPTTFVGRLLSWLGRMHPFVVHFPIALVPASWVALLIARRRGHAMDLVRPVVILAGLAAVGAALLGWLNAGFAFSDANPVQLWHRWLGTALAGLIGALAVWTWRDINSISSRFMVWALGALSLLLLAQGWLGATLTHGIAHMSF